MKVEIVLVVLYCSKFILSIDEKHENITKAEEEYRAKIELNRKKNFATLIKAIDKNKDSRIDLMELETWIVAIIKQSDFEQSTSKFRYYDDDNSKNITWSEYVEKKYNLHEYNIEHMQNETKPSEHTKLFLRNVNLKKRKFHLADMNKDGVLNIKEFVMFNKPRSFPYMASVEIDAVLNDFDWDHDGQLDSKEFLGHDHDNTDPEFIKNNKEEFEINDKNKNGKLDRAEIWNWIMPGIQSIAHTEAQRLFLETGGHDSKSLDFNSILTKYHIWLRSEATNHGQKLEDSPKDENRHDEL